MRKIALSGAILSVLSFGALADTPTFNFVEVGYTDSFDSDGLDGVEVNGSFELNDSFFLNVNYMAAEEDNLIDIDGYVLGLGYKNDLSDNSVWFAQADYLTIDSEITLPSFSTSNSENGYQLSLGVVSQVSENWELSAAAKYIDVFESDTYAEFGAVYSFTDTLGVYFDVETDFDDSNYAVGLRMSF